MAKKHTEIMKAYGRTKKGITTAWYSKQKAKERGRPGRKKIAVKYTSKELRAWTFSQPEFHKIFEKWVKSGYETLLRPSLDRINSLGCYEFSNVQVMTWGDNLKKYREVDIHNKAI